MALTSQKTGLWYQNPDTGALIKIQCAKSITGLSGARDQAETTCLDADAREYIPGLITPGTATVAIDPDPRYTGHKELQALHVSGQKVDWIIGKSDGTLPPSSTRGVVGINITNAGLGYEDPPVVVFTGGGGTGAAATAVIGPDGNVESITIDNPGTGYTSAPVVSFTGDADVDATATATFAWYIVAPTSRSWLRFNGYVSDFPFDFQPGQPVTSNVGIQLSGLAQPQWKAP